MDRIRAIKQKRVAPYAALLTPEWEASAVEGRGNDKVQRERLELGAGSGRSVGERYREYGTAVFEKIRAVLRGKPEADIVLQIVVPEESEGTVLSGLAGMLKTAHLENPHFHGQLILVPASMRGEELADASEEVVVRYRQGQRTVLRWREVEEQSESDIAPAFREDGVYLITGGLGGLGLAFAKEVLQQTRTGRVVLTGRREAKPEGLPADRVSYRQVDLEDLEDVQRLVAEVKQEYGSIQGILHSAGMIADNYIVKKESREFRQVLGPKVIGTECLDEATRELELDYFVLFSSIASAMGNAGQADYAAANGFLDQFAAYRNGLVAAGQRHGKTRSINWPLWAEGGMRVEPEVRELLERSTGLRPLATATGMRAFRQILSLPYDQVLVGQGDVSRLHRALLGVNAPQPGKAEPVAASDAGSLQEKTEEFLRQELAGVLKLPKDRIDSQAALEQYGIDSILAMKLTSRLEETFGSLPKTLFFEYQTIRELAAYFVRSQSERLASLLEPTPRPQAVVVKPPVTRARFQKLRREAGAVSEERIAIIGLSGRYPQADDLEAYWSNLRAGKDCIEEVPKARWDWREYYSADRTSPGHHYSKWGGFIRGVDEFDPLFFNISPKEAHTIDPQERLFLQHAWMALEDAGYTRAALQVSDGTDLPGQVGVYVGVMYSEYPLLAAEASLRGRRMGLASGVASIANRVSYVLNLHGPSMTLDTMCSSSLTAIHLACQDLKLGRTSLAIAGGVNVSIHPNKYLMLSAGQFISSEGRCQSFGEGGDGYIPAEGVGVAVLKRLSEAERDGDHIYGVIRGSAVNHGGKTNGYTVPNPQAQASVIRRALRESHTEARHISYVEAHGTGTKLGDPIEIAALSQAFGSEERGYCLLGSAKSNVGHCESAAGMAGLTKVLLQMRHGEVVASLHAEQLNPHIDFGQTPFVVNRSLRAWEQPEVNGRKLPRIAGISSFGAGGSNGHLIVEEYRAERERSSSNGSEFVIVLSARTAEQLRQKVRDLLGYVQANGSGLDLESLAYTLQTGREAMQERLGFIIHSAEELADKLRAYEKDEESSGVYRAQAKRNTEASQLFSSDGEYRTTHNLIDRWVKGLDVDWAKLYGDRRPARISLPTYPFARERYWIDTVREPAPVNVPRPQPLHRGKITLPPNRAVAPERLENRRLTAAGKVSLGRNSRVNLYDNGGGVYEIEVGGGDAIGELLRALERARQEPALRVLKIGGLRAEYNQAVRQGLYRALAEFPYPTIAVLPAGASGAGLLAAAICDFMVCSEEASYGYMGASRTEAALLRERFGAAPAHALIQTTESLTGRQLRDKGWSCPIVPAAEVQQRAQQLAAALAVKPPEAMRLLKQHLTRGVATLVAELQEQSVAEQDSPRAIVVQQDHIHVETRADGVSVIELRVANRQVRLAELAGEFRAVWEQIEAASRAVVLTSDDAEFIGEANDWTATLEFERLLMQSQIPVVAALPGNATGEAWLIAQCCDACVYSQSGMYGVGSLRESAEQARVAAAVLAERMGTSAAQEALLTGVSYTGTEPREQVLPKALELAAQWAKQPRGVWAECKQATVAAVQQNRKRLLPEWPPEENEPAEPVSLKLQSPMVTVTAHPEGIVVVRMQDREAKNMFSDALIAGLEEVFAQIERSAAYKVVVLTGYEDYFASGGTKETLLAVQAGTMQFTENPVFQQMLNCKLPVIAAMEGHAIGAGLCLGLLADVVLMGEESRYVSPYMNYGFTPGVGATWVLPEKMGQDLGRESLLTGDTYTGGELRKRGLQLRILPRREVYDAAMSLAGQMAQSSRRVLRGLKSQWTTYVQQRLQETYEQELAMHSQTFVGQPAVLAQIESSFSDAESRAADTADDLGEVMAGVRTLLAHELQMRESDIDETTNFLDLGLDSIAGVSWIRKINQKYGTSIAATKVYSYPTLAELGRYVKDEAAKLGVQPARKSPVEVVRARLEVRTPVVEIQPPPARSVSAPAHAMPAPAGPQPIAVIGMAGQFPQAKNVEEFWRNIAAGRNCITEISEQRWDVAAYYQAGDAAEGKTNSKWMGALQEYDRFDPFFFNISPTEAECMDPQQRLFLQACWHAIEDGGYAAGTLSGSKCGVFVGCTSGDYHELSRQHQLSAQGFTGNAISILAARISYFLNLQGPCVSIDTACSSSLVAIAQACDSLNSGASDVALAGGVYVMAGPAMHIQASQTGMLSSQGQCFTFDQRANGFVPGEAVGVVLLKRLRDAERDGDIIHGVLRGWGVNQDGKTNGITAPNPQSQTRLEQEVYERYQIDPANIQLLETHGTGTKLGDPIEVEALKQSFGKYTRETGYCALGSVKSNIGHSLTAAGIAGVIKTLLALKRRQLPPTINFERLNEHIDLNGSPFYVNTRLQEWQPKGAAGRQAAVSSFGFSGTNAHLVIGEYASLAAAAQPATGLQPQASCMIPLSARKPEQLQEQARQLLEFVRTQAPPPDLAALAYTLQTGREPMEERAAFLVRSLDELAAKLEAYVAGQQNIEHAYQGQVRRGRDSIGILTQDAELRQTVLTKWMAQKKYGQLLEWWVKGLELDWRSLYDGIKPPRISLPGYPFAKERYWIEAGTHVVSAGATPVLHPLLHANTSDLGEQRYTSVFTGQEFFLADHRIAPGGSSPRKILPAAVSLEMARAAISLASPSASHDSVLVLRDVSWLKPIEVAEPKEISIAVTPDVDEQLQYEIYCTEDKQRIVYSRGKALFDTTPATSRLDLEDLRRQMPGQMLGADEVYATLK
ncbi:MAG TPA: SDR family NAD(P)-dependent oxidoreductase, partial [Candidatus Binatia bacterium]|nr:SDR family NAD(P)-dependent oxidoreductase [Candidatus Binatia bacterium]